MKTFLHYLNWLLHDFNRVCFYVIKHYIKYGLIFLLMLGISIPVLYFDSETAIVLWVFVLSFVSLFIAITWMIKHEKPETEEESDQSETAYTATQEFKPKSWKQSAIVSAKWVLYTIFLFVSSILIISNI